MKRKKYIQIQVDSSEWTRKNSNNMALVRDAVREFYKYVPTTYRVLELGCGDGYSLDVLKTKGYRQIVGCDINLAKLRIAASFDHNVFVQDVHNIGFRSGVFDAVYCTHTLEHSYNGYEATREIYRVLRPGGLLFIILPDHTRDYGDIFIKPNEVIPIEQRSDSFYEDLMFKRRGTRAPTSRNQFPFTMKLLLATLFEAELEVQWTARIVRNGPELWAIAAKPELGSDHVKPLIIRAWKDQSLVCKLYCNWTKGVRSIVKHLRTVSQNVVQTK